MNIREFREKILFRFIQPETIYLRSYSDVKEGSDVNVDVLNTYLPENRLEIITTLREICKIPRMSTIAIGALINWTVANMLETQAFVNVGIWHGFTFLSGIVHNPQKTAIGIDNFSQFGGPRDAFLCRFNHYKSNKHIFHEMDCFEYFQKFHRETIGLYVYDADHSYESQLKGLQIAEPFFGPGCLILIDDTNIQSVRKAVISFITTSHHVYRVLLDEPTKNNYHPTFWNGIMILEKIS